MGKRESKINPGKGVTIAKTAVVDRSARIGKGTAVWHFSQIMRDAAIGEDCVIGNGVFIDRKVVVGNNVKIMSKALIHRGIKIEDDCFIGPAACFINDKNPRNCKTRDISSPEWVMGKGASIGAGALILCDINIGKYSLVGAGAVVTKDVEPHGIVAGNPARLIGHVCFCGEKLEKRSGDHYCKSCKKAVLI
ncbi:MAG: acyltransferase [Candidatus Omnitrophota bacterium]|nr:acyltransferase [Candidatus Omnitrophota bacterium]